METYDRRCIICSLRGKNHTIGELWFKLCEKHNTMVELDTIDALIVEAIEYKNNQNQEIERFIAACKHFRETV